jgi:hypothetical protein
MKTLLKEFRFQGLTFKQKAIVLYFVLSICLLCIGDGSPVWAIVLVVLNFANASRLVKKVPLPDID